MSNNNEVFKRHFDVTDSTMNQAKELLIDGKHQVWVTANIQTAGRGRRGSEWSSNHKGVFATYGKLLQISVDKLQGLSLAVAISILESCELEKFNIRIKWPNDLILFNDYKPKKLAGILIETLVQADKVLLLVGVGINTIEVPFIYKDEAICLKSVDNSFEQTSEFEDCIYNAISDAVSKICSFGFAYFKDSWDKYNYHSKSDRLLGVEYQGEILTGKYIGVSDDGQLKIQIDDKIFQLSSGHLIHY